MEFKIGKTREEHVKNLRDKVEKLQTPKRKFLWLPKEMGYKNGVKTYKWFDWVTVSYPYASIEVRYGTGAHPEYIVTGPLVFHTGVIF